MGDAERDIFWLGTAMQSLLTLGRADGIVKGRNSISEILNEIIGTLIRNGISGNLLSQAQDWATCFKETYAENERIRSSDKDRFIADCENWKSNFSDMMKDRFAHPKEIYERLPKIDQIYDAVRQNLTAENQFVYTTPEKRQIKDKVFEAIESSRQPDEILITGYFDHAILDKLNNALKRGVQVRLVVCDYKNRPGAKDNIDATKRVMIMHAKVKQHDTNHARLMIFGDKSALVSSADPKTDSLDNNYEAGIWTTNRFLIEDCKKFFGVLWKEGKNWSM